MAKGTATVLVRPWLYRPNFLTTIILHTHLDKTNLNLVSIANEFVGSREGGLRVFGINFHFYGCV